MRAPPDELSVPRTPASRHHRRRSACSDWTRRRPLSQAWTRGWPRTAAPCGCRAPGDSGPRRLFRAGRFGAAHRAPSTGRDRHELLRRLGAASPAATGCPVRSASRCIPGITTAPARTWNASGAPAGAGSTGDPDAALWREWLRPGQFYQDPLYAYLIGLTYRVAVLSRARCSCGSSRSASAPCAWSGRSPSACSATRRRRWPARWRCRAPRSIYDELLLLRESTIAFAGLLVAWLATRARCDSDTPRCCVPWRGGRPRVHAQEHVRPRNRRAGDRNAARPRRLAGGRRVRTGRGHPADAVRGTEHRAGCSGAGHGGSPVR